MSVIRLSPPAGNNFKALLRGLCRKRAHAELGGNLLGGFFNGSHQFLSAFGLQPKRRQRDREAVMNFAITIKNRRADGTETVHYSLAAAESKAALFDPGELGQ